MPAVFDHVHDQIVPAVPPSASGKCASNSLLYTHHHTRRPTKRSCFRRVSKFWKLDSSTENSKREQGSAAVGGKHGAKASQLHSVAWTAQ